MTFWTFNQQNHTKPWGLGRWCFWWRITETYLKSPQNKNGHRHTHSHSVYVYEIANGWEVCELSMADTIIPTFCRMAHILVTETWKKMASCHMITAEPGPALVDSMGKCTLTRRCFDFRAERFSALPREGRASDAWPCGKQFSKYLPRLGLGLGLLLLVLVLV